MKDDEPAPDTVETESDNESYFVEDRRGIGLIFKDERVVTELAHEIGVYGNAIYDILLQRGGGSVSIKKLCEPFGLARSTVCLALKDLERVGLIRIIRKKDDQGINYPNRYILLPFPEGGRPGDGLLPRQTVARESCISMESLESEEDSIHTLSSLRSESVFGPAAAQPSPEVSHHSKFSKPKAAEKESQGQVPSLLPAPVSSESPPPPDPPPSPAKTKKARKPRVKKDRTQTPAQKSWTDLVDAVLVGAFDVDVTIKADADASRGRALPIASKIREVVPDALPGDLLDFWKCEEPERGGVVVSSVWVPGAKQGTEQRQKVLSPNVVTSRLRMFLNYRRDHRPKAFADRPLDAQGNSAEFYGDDPFCPSVPGLKARQVIYQIREYVPCYYVSHEAKWYPLPNAQKLTPPQIPSQPTSGNGSSRSMPTPTPATPDRTPAPIQANPLMTLTRSPASSP